MKNNSNPVKNLIIFIVILASFSITYILIDKFTEKEEKIIYLKNYEVNEYIPTYISDEDMAKIYLNDYVYKMYSNPEEAYNLLDEEYRNEKFGSLEKYIDYVYSLQYDVYTLTKYYKQEKNGYIIFGVYDKNDNLYIFKTKGVLQYKVYLDDYTVEI